MLDKLPSEVRHWVEGLSWQQRRYMLSLCHLLCAATPQDQAQFLDDFTAEGIIAKILVDQDTQQQMRGHLERFRIGSILNEKLLRTYIRQFYVHSAQDMHRRPQQYLQSALQLVIKKQEQNKVLNYILGFEVLKMFFQMSWEQQEKLYQLQINQDYFYNRYIKPIQYTHRINSIVVPKDEKVFFAKRDYYIQIPQIPTKKLVTLIMATFSTDAVIDFGFSISRNSQYLIFDFDYIFAPAHDPIFA
ncbi:hypothetical protein Lepto7376_0857 [[Leptolyngbya] sp. PCC 7376]|uniref:hypothetical protein n=1 Tax=[Leptolyngbya] sp. PCC 7376 TaxID=111781 RepID=UPI00029F1440|nr:hypothetical protein [[Leptolyngbya] sp. PCC 7376]AFY37252.1 hypothetical protein Lepto7376_0857 [[Leptolyngbya] sp. PCC 7376]